MEVKMGEADLFFSRNKTEVKILRKGSLKQPAMEQSRVLVLAKQSDEKNLLCRE